MRAVRSAHTKPEMIVRRLAHSLGYRFRLHRRDLPGSPDLVFPSRKMVVFVHGCFWHSHSGCRRATIPAENREFWIAKLRKNALRDTQQLAQLASEGWSTHVVWECETRDTRALEARLRSFLDPDLERRDQNPGL
jgi:DNA mismatch endonuclease Vsr